MSRSFSSCGVRALEVQGSLVVGERAYLPQACGIFIPWPELKPGSLALEGRFLTSGPPGKSPGLFLRLKGLYSHSSGGAQKTFMPSFDLWAESGPGASWAIFLTHLDTSWDILLPGPLYSSSHKVLWVDWQGEHHVAELRILNENKLPWWLGGSSVCLQCGRPGFDSLGREDPLVEKMANLLQYSCLENPMDGGAS